MSVPCQAALDAAERIYANRMSGKRDIAKELFAVEIQKAIDSETEFLNGRINVMCHQLVDVAGCKTLEYAISSVRR